MLIDTAGRYTTQDSNAAVDRAGWDAFLDLLRRTRPRQPLNGVIVAIALSDIANAPSDERLAHARAIRRRIKEVEERLGIRLPVYALFTKADLIAGFTEFFDDLDRERREQVWGVTFPFGKADPGPVGQFPEELQLLVEQSRRSPVRSPAGRAKPGAPRPDRGISDADRLACAAPAGLSCGSLWRVPARPCASAARRLFRLWNPRGHPDRPVDRGRWCALSVSTSAARPPCGRCRVAATSSGDSFPR